MKACFQVIKYMICKNKLKTIIVTRLTKHIFRVITLLLLTILNLYTVLGCSSQPCHTYILNTPNLENMFPADALSPPTITYSSKTNSYGTQSYLSPSCLSTLVLNAIRNKEIPSDEIVSYSEQDTHIDTGESITLLTIDYGCAGDIPYTYTCLFVMDRSMIFDLPNINFSTAIWGQYPFNISKIVGGQLSNFSNKAYQTVAFRKGNFGWIYKIESMTFIWTHWVSDEKRLIEEQCEYYGEVFVYYDQNKKVKWDISNLKGF
jgi:hypothetical protein